MSVATVTYYSPEEILAIFKEQRRLCAPLDPMADPSYMIERDSPVDLWRASGDMLDWDYLVDFLNQEFRVSIPLRDWKTAMLPEHKKTVWDVCLLLSKHAQKPDFQPVKRFGQDCLSAGVFLTLKKNLKSKGVDVSELRPSSLIEPYLDKHFSPMLEEITLTGVQVLDKLEVGPPTSERRFVHWLDRFIPRFVFHHSIDTGGIVTFRDLVEKILENQPLSKPQA